MEACQLWFCFVLLLIFIMFTRSFSLFCYCINYFKMLNKAYCTFGVVFIYIVSQRRYLSESGMEIVISPSSIFLFFLVKRL